ncbi:hypothetical protein FB45DRAFT_931632 [Roridomyces roridus]|uniref:Uncharacterized protein n=1 Tax=Roridomyces roridus TaxID=1738132 RepID=A0AAD7BDT7_9AGAR|nr:hypothetical protein FB45DRAFT_931632 [Roridomyces roridus]
MSTIVFLGAPSASEVHRSADEYHWRTVAWKSHPTSTQAANATRVYPPATLDAATRRISLMYNNVIFNEGKEEEEEPDETFFTWPPTAAPGDEPDSQEDHSIPPSFSTSPNLAVPHFSLFSQSLTSLTSLAKTRVKGTKKVSLLVAVLEVDGPDSFYLKTGKDAGKESWVLKMILGDEDGNVCKLTAWREVAQDWGGAGQEIGVKRGDILLLTDVMAAFEPATNVALTASPWQKPKLEICYRTMPYTHEDQRLRPDLRLGASDASVRKVAAVVRWFEHMAGLTGAQ